MIEETLDAPAKKNLMHVHSMQADFGDDEAEIEQLFNIIDE